MKFIFDKNLNGEVTIMNEYKQNCYNALCNITYDEKYEDVVLYLYGGVVISGVDEV